VSANAIANPIAVSCIVFSFDRFRPTEKPPYATSRFDPDLHDRDSRRPQCRLAAFY
jgi:hypothetical protein